MKMETVYSISIRRFTGDDYDKWLIEFDDKVIFSMDLSDDKFKGAMCDILQFTQEKINELLNIRYLSIKTIFKYRILDKDGNELLPYHRARTIEEAKTMIDALNVYGKSGPYKMVEL